MATTFETKQAITPLV